MCRFECPALLGLPGGATKNVGGAQGPTHKNHESESGWRRISPGPSGLLTVLTPPSLRFAVRRGSPRKPGGDRGRKPHGAGPRSAQVTKLECRLPHYQWGPLGALHHPHGPRHQRGHGHRGEGGCFLPGAPGTCPRTSSTEMIFTPNIQEHRMAPNTLVAEAAFTRTWSCDLQGLGRLTRPPPRVTLPAPP